VATDGTPRGFLVGAPLRGRSRAAIVPAAGHTAAPELLPALYAAVAGALGPGEHHVQVGEHDPATRAAFAALGFRDFLVVMLAALPPSGAAAAGHDIRQATGDDIDAVVALARMQQAHHAAPPMSVAPSDADEHVRWRRVLIDPRAGVWLAHARARAVGMLVLQPPGATFSPLHLPEATVHLPDAIVAPEARGTGLGSALLAEALGWVHAIGYRHVALHVHAANAPARAFWTARGFRAVAHQLVRPGVTS
jgi:ribosomal protein S18 acetylase RimI-like enzyme